jgi:hypothetical protein
VDTAHGGLAGVFGARILIAAVQGLRSGAHPVCARVLDRAGVTVITEPVERLVHAADGHLTGVIGAGVLVIAAVGGTRAAHAGLAIILHGADLSILTGLALDRVSDGAQTRDQVTVGAQAGLELAARRGALRVIRTAGPNHIGQLGLGEVGWAAAFGSSGASVDSAVLTLRLDPSSFATHQEEGRDEDEHRI